MLDIKFVRENPDAVKENIRKKFQDAKLPLVDEVLELDRKNRAAITEASELRASRNALSKEIGKLMGMAKKDPSKLDEAEKVKAQVKAQADRLAELEVIEDECAKRIREIMLLIPNIIEKQGLRKIPKVRTTMAITLMVCIVVYFLYMGLTTGFNFRA